MLYFASTTLNTSTQSSTLRTPSPSIPDPRLSATCLISSTTYLMPTWSAPQPYTVMFSGPWCPVLHILLRSPTAKSLHTSFSFTTPMLPERGTTSSQSLTRRRQDRHDFPGNLSKFIKSDSDLQQNVRSALGHLRHITTHSDTVQLLRLLSTTSCYACQWVTAYVQSKRLFDNTCNAYHMLNAPKHAAYTIFPRRSLHQIRHYLTLSIPIPQSFATKEQRYTRSFILI